MNQTIEFQQNIIFSYVLVLSMYGGEVIAIGIVYALSFRHQICYTVAYHKKCECIGCVYECVLHMFQYT